MQFLTSFVEPHPLSVVAGLGVELALAAESVFNADVRVTAADVVSRFAASRFDPQFVSSDRVGVTSPVASASWVTATY
jgi:hypothetical protein